MTKALKFFLAILLTASLSIATVICCCIAPSVMAHFHKTVVCSHCSAQGSDHHAPNPAAACQNQLTSADLSHSVTISILNVSGAHFLPPTFFEKYITALPPSFSLAFPPGSSPLGISLTPLYLRTFNLRI